MFAEILLGDKLSCRFLRLNLPTPRICLHDLHVHTSGATPNEGKTRAKEMIALLIAVVTVNKILKVQLLEDFAGIDGRWPHVDDR